MPTKEEILNKVHLDIAEYASYPKEKLKDEFILKENPLKMDNPSLNFMTLSLRGYVKKHNSKQTLLAKEVKKSKLTVKLLGELVFGKIKG
ncbi:hypothetical protein [Spongiimicrobium sp. 2-473A-2-J]|uniref:hypothetical protein n=1 Tax=Eudoraea algarum TaxID=3417568 RepID=UPI003D36D871